MRFSQNDFIADLEWDYFAVSRSVFGATLGATLGATFVSWGRQRHTYLPAAISARNSSTALRAATSKSVLDCEA